MFDWLVGSPGILLGSDIRDWLAADQDRFGKHAEMSKVYGFGAALVACF